MAEVVAELAAQSPLVLRLGTAANSGTEDVALQQLQAQPSLLS